MPAALGDLAAAAEVHVPPELKAIISCPDMVSLYHNIQTEEERRRRRLERNRASARLRRQKKKTMVQSFEHEVLPASLLHPSLPPPPLLRQPIFVY